jgi:hypothetical protein
MAVWVATLTIRRRIGHLHVSYVQHPVPCKQRQGTESNINTCLDIHDEIEAHSTDGVLTCLILHLARLTLQTTSDKRIVYTQAAHRLTQVGIFRALT